MVKVLLVIECTPSVNWYSIFADSKLHGVEPIQVEQCTWGELSSVVSYPEANVGCQCEIKKSAHAHAGTSQERQRTIRPDFILMRSVTRSVGHLDDRNKLFALKHANIPSVNSLHSCYMALERGWMFSELKLIQQRLGESDFPLVKQIFYANAGNMVIDPGFPNVVKIGPYHSGFGKILIKDASAFQDIRGIVAMHADYATAEPFVDWDWDIRIQKIGPNYRAFRRQSPNWKGNVGNQSINSDTEVTPQYKRWVDECAKAFGGLDILALDAVHDKKTGKDIILELNDTAIGLAHRYEKEDYAHMRTLVMTRMAEHFPLTAATATAATATDSKDVKTAAPTASATAAAPAATATTAAAVAPASASASASAGVVSDLSSPVGVLAYQLAEQRQAVAELEAQKRELQKRIDQKANEKCVLM